MRVLVVSEDATERARATSALGLDADAEVVEAGSAAEVRARILEHGERFDVLVVDGDLQPRGGFATLYDLRSRSELTGAPAIPSLVMISREQDRWLAGWAGASATSTKPVDPFELARQVRELAGSDVPPFGDAGATKEQLAAAIRGHTEHQPG